ncbi:hypothetical protein KY336_02685, partial [Candidatus Woesearchaeota archaeon]|nr:hypothetical protein [Candidatus Woesearchaeota archaeon]
DREAIDEQWRMQNPSVFSATLNGTEPVRIGWKWNGERQLFEPDGDTHCEDMNVILGKEAEHRRHTNNLAHYLSEAPDLGRKILEQR